MEVDVELIALQPVCPEIKDEPPAPRIPVPKPVPKFVPAQPP